MVQDSEDGERTIEGATSPPISHTSDDGWYCGLTLDYVAFTCSQSMRAHLWLKLFVVSRDAAGTLAIAAAIEGQLDVDCGRLFFAHCSWLLAVDSRRLSILRSGYFK